MSDSLARIRAYSAANPFNAGRVRPTKKAASGRKRPEYDLHRLVVVALKKRLPADACVMFMSNPRQGNDSAAAADRIHRSVMGALPGAPDLIVLHQGHAYGIELKASKGVLSPAQKWCHSLLLGCGVPVSVCRSIEEVEGFLSDNNIPLTAVRVP